MGEQPDTESTKTAPRVLARPTQVFHPEHGFQTLSAGTEVPDWAIEQITNPRCFEPIEEPAEQEEQDLLADPGTGPFEARKRDQLYAVAMQFPEVAAEVSTKSLKAEILKALDRHGIEPGTVPDED